ncbi:methylglyoxal synthase [Ciceribacter ferrooxidans]|uniref:Methylglyoxal synthase n=1 Tax=Ciceribacter ferrooxidans TaxID=2509717 RepID=A0A4Q2SVB5_9HYPH|nr:methylglyoxal synthase [Ciceribacter ferrooxidans]RYC09742.1 methylglyoxal synthase [Ciceribacter ferrooxidans]
MPERHCIALIAHDQKKDELAEFAGRHAEVLARFRIIATGTTGGRVAEACPGLDVVRMKSGPLGGDQQIGAMIATGEVQMLIFFVDPLTAMPHDVDVKALMRLAIVYDIPMALNLATAEILMTAKKN